MKKEDFLTVRWNNMLRQSSLYWAGGFRGDLLNYRRTAFSHAVRMVKEKLRFPRFRRTEHT